MRHHKFQSPNPKLQITSNDQHPNNQKPNQIFIPRIWSLDFGYYLTIDACSLVIKKMANGSNEGILFLLTLSVFQLEGCFVNPVSLVALSAHGFESMLHQRVRFENP